MNIIESRLDGTGLRFALVASRFNDLVTGHLVEGARDTLVRHGVREEDIDLVRVPGAFEIPLAAGRLAESGRYHALVAMGAVIRGATPHFDYVAAEVSKGLAQEELRTGVPVIFSVLTCDTLEQALERAGSKGGNKGSDGALAALEMARLMEMLPPRAGA